MPAAGKILAVIFAFACVGGSFGAGCMFQVNQTFQQLVGITGGPETSFWVGKGWLFGVLISLLTAAVIIGGIKSIARVTDKLVPFMCIFYVVTCLFVILAHASDLPRAFSAILTALSAAKQCMEVFSAF